MSSEVNPTVPRPPTSFHSDTPPERGRGRAEPGGGGKQSKSLYHFPKMISLKRIHPRKNLHLDSLG